MGGVHASHQYTCITCIRINVCVCVCVYFIVYTYVQYVYIVIHMYFNILVRLTNYGREETCQIMVSVCLFNPCYTQQACRVCTVYIVHSFSNFVQRGRVLKL